jgi:hypothetical protein
VVSKGWEAGRTVGAVGRCRAVILVILIAFVIALVVGLIILVVVVYVVVPILVDLVVFVVGVCMSVREEEKCIRVEKGEERVGTGKTSYHLDYHERH